jgi:hypothetical protein
VALWTRLLQEGQRKSEGHTDEGQYRGTWPLVQFIIPEIAKQLVAKNKTKQKNPCIIHRRGRHSNIWEKTETSLVKNGYYRP